MKVLERSIVYDNPLPQLRSRQSCMPFACECKDGSILVMHEIGEAFESADKVPYVAKSFDGGKTWSESKLVLSQDRIDRKELVSFGCKPAVLSDGRIVAIGYGFERANKDLPVGNPVTGGLQDDIVFYLVSEDNGETWSDMNEIHCSWGPHIEASAPLTILQDGTWITPITGFPDWEGKMTGPMCGCALRSEDEGKTWNDNAVCMEFDGKPVTCYEQRMCQLESGTIVNIGWNENTETGERLNNHFTYSADNGKTWSKAASTGIQGQASSVCAVGGEKLLALHAVRRDTDRPGVYAYVIDFSEKTWNIVDELLVWEPSVPVTRDTKMAEIFAFLKFGQPGAICLKDGDVIMTHWFAQEGQYRTMVTRIQL